MALALNTGFMSRAMKPRRPVASSTASATLPVLDFMKASMTSAVEGSAREGAPVSCRAVAGREKRHSPAAIHQVQGTPAALVVLIATSLEGERAESTTARAGVDEAPRGPRAIPAALYRIGPGARQAP